MNRPKIAVIVPCYLQATYLDDCLNSIYKQKYINWECIIVDDGSPDNTEEVAQTWVTKDSRFKYFKKENNGLSSARNFGLQQTNAEYIQFLDCDDFIHIDKFESFAKELETSSHDVLLSDFQMYLEDSYIAPFCILKEEYFNYKSILFQWDIDFSIPIHCAIFKKSILPPHGFNTELKAKEDWLFWIQCFENNPKIIWKNDVFNYYRLHPKSMTSDRIFMMENTKRINAYLIKYIKEEQLDDFIIATHNRYMTLFKGMNDEIKRLQQTLDYPNSKTFSTILKKYIKQRWHKITQSKPTSPK